MGQRDRGSITVFLAITFIFIMAMLGTLIDGARLVEAHSQLYYAADLAATSALAGFNYKLKDRYGLFAYDGDAGDVINEVVSQNLSLSSGGDASEEFYRYVYDTVLGLFGEEDIAYSQPFDLLQFQNIAVSQPQEPTTLRNPNEFERQILEYIKFRGAVELFQSDITFDFGEFSREMELASNEAKVDEAMRKLETRLANHVEDEGKYNENLLNPFREKMWDIRDTSYSAVRERLGGDRSFSGLGEVSGLLGELSYDLVVAEVIDTCSEAQEALDAMDQERDQIIRQADAMLGQFSGEGENAAYQGQPISAEMLENYKNDLEKIKDHADFRWGKKKNGTGAETHYNSSIAQEKERYAKIKSSTAMVLASIPGYQDEITELLEKLAELEANEPGPDASKEEKQKYAEEMDRLEKSMHALWSEIWGFISAPGERFRPEEMGIFGNTGQLNNLFSWEGGEKADKDKADEWSKQAKKKLESIPRSYEREIPGDYLLFVDFSEEKDVGPKLDLNTDFKKKSVSEADEMRDGNLKSTNGVKDLFSGIGEFTLDTFDNAMLGLYAIGNFRNALCGEEKVPAAFSHEKGETEKYAENLRNDPNDYAFFEDCEVEYLIKGSRKEQKNYQGIRNELTGIYFTLNWAGVRKAPTIRAAVEAIARAAQAATAAIAGLLTLGLGSGAGVIAYYATREACYAALAGIQTSHDLDRLYTGGKVPLIKKADKDFCGLSSMVGLPISCKESGGGIPIRYVDYLFIRMVLTGPDRVRMRLQDLVEVSMNSTGGDVDTSRPFKLEDEKTEVSVKAQADMPFFFINIMFMAENMDKTGMTLVKSTAQKY